MEVQKRIKKMMKEEKHWTQLYIYKYLQLILFCFWEGDIGLINSFERETTSLSQQHAPPTVVH